MLKNGRGDRTKRHTTFGVCTFETSSCYWTNGIKEDQKDTSITSRRESARGAARAGDWWWQRRRTDYVALVAGWSICTPDDVRW
ncbi:hypothetical protein E2C01_035564 [Portunus trituberculatus]|uniref:Uncharacterized protein n=1 Tax=Portunus trituberculatus TaxID=210409 RepID=A0A5B7FA41_PORTR|nr:hypothetical protein [Portunus trituberculatus]